MAKSELTMQMLGVPECRPVHYPEATGTHRGVEVPGPTPLPVPCTAFYRGGNRYGVATNHRSVSGLLLDTSVFLAGLPARDRQQITAGVLPHVLMLCRIKAGSRLLAESEQYPDREPGPWVTSGNCDPSALLEVAQWLPDDDDS